MKSGRREKTFTWMFICMVLYLVNAMFKYFLPTNATKMLPIVSLTIALFMTVRGRDYKLKLNKMEIFLFAFIVMWFFGCLYSPSMSRGLGFVFSLALAVILQMLLRVRDFNEKKIMRIIVIVCIALVLAVIIQPIMPNTIDSISRSFHYTREQYGNMRTWAYNGWYSGLFPDRAPAAFFGVLLTGTGLYHIFMAKIKHTSIYTIWVGIALYIIGVYCILLTAKRGLLMGCFISTFLTYVIYKKAQRISVFRICILAGILVAVGWIIISNIEAAQNMLDRFNDKENFYSGRLEIYDDIFESISENILFGTGTASAQSVLGIGGHNIYLTVFMENGIFSVIVFIGTLLCCFTQSVKSAFKVYIEGCSSILPIQMFSIYIQIFFIVYGFSGNPLYDNYILYFYVFAIFITGNVAYRLNKIKGAIV